MFFIWSYTVLLQSKFGNIFFDPFGVQCVLPKSVVKLFGHWKDVFPTEHGSLFMELFYSGYHAGSVAGNK